MAHLAVHPRRFLVALGLTLACAREPELPFDLPRVVATSEYIEYGTWADDTSLCMDGPLALLDRHVEATAEYLGAAPPAAKIRYTFVPEPLKDADTWPCPEGAQACNISFSDRSYSFASVLDEYHEIVHAVDFAAFGNGHFVLKEGLATYLARNDDNKTDRYLKNFPAHFRSIVEPGQPIDYERSMHFVGSILERDGVEKFKELRARVPLDAGYEEFAAAYLEVYGQDLDEALAEMTTPIHSWFEEPDPCAGEPIPWGEGMDLEVKLRGRCGDGFFFGGGLVDDKPGFYKSYTIDVPVAGWYTMWVSGTATTSYQITGNLRNCPGTEHGGLSSFNGAGLLQPGRYRLDVGFPHAATPAGELDLKLRYVEPP